MLTVLSLGAGVQSTTLALMAAAGEITPMPDCAIFADTGWEPKAVYDHLDWLCSPNVLPFPVHRVNAGSIYELTGKRRQNGQWPRMGFPAFTRSADGSEGMTRRSCTQDFKIEPLTAKVRQLAGLYRKRSPLRPVVEQWIGISRDEAHRMKPSGETWRVNRWPLIEADMTRTACLRWMAAHEYPKPPKSSCIGCPFHSDEQWRGLTKEEFGEAVEMDRRIRTLRHGQRQDVDLYLHRSRKPLDQVDLSTAVERGQPDLFGNECEGMCGV